LDILGLTGIRILAIDEDTQDFHIQAESLSSPSCCAHCHSLHLYRHEIKPQLFLDLPIRGKRVGIIMQRHRYRCCACHRTFFESLPGMNESHLMTTRLLLSIQQTALRRPL
jgi:transposase